MKPFTTTNTTTTSALAVLLLSAAGLTAAHMEMKSPPPLRSKFNKFSTSADYDMTSPLAGSGANFPCKGYLGVLGTPEARSVADWAPGQQQSLTVTGGANHDGGSCQASLSLDGGKTWKAIHSWIGSCPVAAGESTLRFAVPADTPAGPALFAWTWFNKVGNREMYMNCAAVTISAAAKGRRRSSRSLASRPDMFVANVGRGCGTLEGSDLMFPDPGPDVDLVSKKTAPPTGSCASGGGGSNPDPSSPASSSPPPPPPPPAPKPAGPDKPQHPHAINNGQMNFPEPTSSTPHASQPPAPTKTSISPGGGSSCTPGAFSCSSDLRAWQVCDRSGTWIHVADCSAGQACMFNSSNQAPYCMAK